MFKPWNRYFLFFLWKTVWNFTFEKIRWYLRSFTTHFYFFLLFSQNDWWTFICFDAKLIKIAIRLKKCFSNVILRREKQEGSTKFDAENRALANYTVYICLWPFSGQNSISMKLWLMCALNQGIKKTNENIWWNQ